MSFPDDARLLAPERLAAMLEGLAGRPGVAELAAHVAALDERLTVTGQYYEEFLIPELEARMSEAGRESRAQMVRQGRAGRAR